MPKSFHRVSQSLYMDRGLVSRTSVVVALLLLSTWVTWAFRARITRYEVSDSARLEVAGAAYPVQANQAGRLVATQLVLGREVQAGEVLAELESQDDRLALAQERQHRAAMEPQLAALRAQLEAEQRGHTDELRVLAVSTDGAQAQYRQAEAVAALAEQEAARSAKLRAEGLISEAEAQRAKADANSKRAAADNMRLAVARLQPELAVRDRDRDVKLKQIMADIAKLESDRAVSSASIQRLEYQIERRQIRAPISGRLSESAALRPGAYISEGQQLGVIVPHAGIEVVAEFAPSAALGKLHPGQRAIVRLQGFPWAQFGTIAAQVSRVAGEIRDGKVRVELAVNRAPTSAIPFQHGLPGSVEVEVERLSPAALLLRSAGQAVGAH